MARHDDGAVPVRQVVDGVFTETVVAIRTPSSWPTAVASDHAAVAALLANQPFTDDEAVVTEALLDEGQLPTSAHFRLPRAGRPSDWVGALPPSPRRICATVPP